MHYRSVRTSPAKAVQTSRKARLHIRVYAGSVLFCSCNEFLARLWRGPL